MSRRTAETVSSIHASLRERIITGRYTPGQPLSQLMIAEDIGVSRTPVREAFRLLEQEGLVVAERNKRFRVARFSPADLEDLYVLRIAVESTAIRTSVPRLDASDMASLDVCLESMNTAIEGESYAAWREPHETFHRLLLARAGKRSQECARDLSAHAERYRYAVTLPTSPTSWGQSHHDHHVLFRAAGDRDGNEAARQIALHYGRVALSYLSLTAPLYDPQVLRANLEVLGA